MAMSPDGARSHESLCWRGPAGVYWTGLYYKAAWMEEIVVACFKVGKHRTA
jgi:hypothetical protein